MASAGDIRFDAGIVAIDTGYVRPLQDASHLIIEDGRAAFVDTGVNDSVPLLLDALSRENLDVGDVDFVLLTHVHLDHAGGAGLLMQSLPNARCVVHPRGAPHISDPSKLIAGTEAVYGVDKAREMYGTIEPIDARRITEATDEAWLSLNGRELQTIYTEGHARHHYVINDPASRSVFAGDSFGVSYRELDTDNGAFIFPTSTPIDFDPEAAHAAIDRILACDPQQVFLTHYSRVDELERLAADMHAGIDAYRQIALDAEGAADRQAALETSMFDYLSRRLEAHGFEGDRAAMWPVLEIDVRLNAQGLDVWLTRRAKRSQ